MSDIKELEAGRVIGSYRVVRCIGQGGMGTVYEVEHVELGVHYALKTFTFDPADEVGGTLKTKFLEEGKVLARLKHANIAHVFDLAFDEATQMPYFVMDLVTYEDGESYTAEDVNLEDIDEELAFKWFKQVAAALDYIHAEGIVHRDIKPANLLVDKDLNVIITDFGISKIFGRKMQTDVEAAQTMVTKTGRGKLVMGTEKYMAPEVEAGDEAVPESDAYALGVMALRWLTGFFYKDNPGAISLLSGKKYRWLSVLPRLLAPTPNRRPATYSDLVKQLKPLAKAAPDKKPVPGKVKRSYAHAIVTAVFVLAAAGGASWFGYQAWQRYEADKKAQAAELKKLAQKIEEEKKAQEEAEEKRRLEERRIADEKVKEEKLAAEQKSKVEKQTQAERESAERSITESEPEKRKESRSEQKSDDDQIKSAKQEMVDKKPNQRERREDSLPFDADELLSGSFPKQKYGGVLVARFCKIDKISSTASYNNKEDNEKLLDWHVGGPQFSFHTEEEDSPFVQIAFPVEVRIKGILVENRKDGCKDRQAPLVVFAEEGKDRWKLICGDDRKQDFYSFAFSKTPVTCSRLRVGRESGAKRQPFHLSKVMIYVDEASAKDVKEAVLGKPAVRTPKTLKFSNSASVELLECPKGEFIMGSPRERRQNSPQRGHKVIISRPFWMSKYKVTHRVIDVSSVYGRYRLSSHDEMFGGMNRVHLISYDQLDKLFDSLNKKFKRLRPPGYVFRLPTEAEWEYALKAGMTADEDDDHVRWIEGRLSSPAEIASSFGDAQALAKTKGVAYQHGWEIGGVEVGLKKPNAWGFYDMVGNIGELTLDVIDSKLINGVDLCGDPQTAVIYKDEETDPLRYDQSVNAMCIARNANRWDSWWNLGALSKQHVGLDRTLSFRIVLGPDLIKEKRIVIKKRKR